MKAILSGAAMSAALLLSPLCNAATLLTDSSGQLIGANNVDVDGVFYDVTFVDDTCESIFSGCVNSGFDFQTLSSATQATQALSDQVFSAPNGFTGDSTDISGCELASFCFLYTPYDDITDTNDSAEVFFLNYSSTGKSTGDSAVGRQDDLSNAVFQVFVDWELSNSTAVPLPAGAWLFLSAIGGLVGIKARGRAK